MDKLSPLVDAAERIPSAELRQVRAEMGRSHIFGSILLCELAWALGVAPMTLWNYAHGRQPSAAILRRWLADSRPWVRRLARNFAKRYQEMMK